MRLEKHLLHHVLGVRGVAQDAPGRAVNERSLLAHDAIPVCHRSDLLNSSVKGASISMSNRRGKSNCEMCGGETPPVCVSRAGARNANRNPSRVVFTVD